MTEVWIHWSQGYWLVTRDGMELIEKTTRIILSDVRFVIDPHGLEISRDTRKRKTHAWAVGSWVDGIRLAVGERLLWQPVTYRPRHGDDHFGIVEAWPRFGCRIGDEDPGIVVDLRFNPLAGAELLDADLEGGWNPLARVSGPRYGETERRQVQHYGGRS